MVSQDSKVHIFASSFFLLIIIRPDRLVIIIIILLFWEFFIPALANGFLLESEWQQVSTILQDSFQYSTRPLISETYSPRTNLLVTVQSAPITIGITVTFIDFSFI